MFMVNKRILSTMLTFLVAFLTVTCLEVKANSGENIALKNTIDQNTNNRQSEFILYDRSNLFKLKDSSNQADEIKTSIDKIVKYADAALKIKPLSVTQKKILIYGQDPHEYVSMAIYYWPDTTKADGKPYINKDGQVNAEKNNNDTYDAARFSKLISTVNKLSLAYYLTGKEAYAQHCAELLRAWFLNADTKMNPNLEYGQGVPGKDKGRYSGIIDTAALIQIIDSIKMIEQSQSWNQTDSEGLKNWFSDYVDWLQQSTFGKKEASTTNNHSVWYDAQVAAFAYYAGREEVTKNIVEEAKTKRIATQIGKDGSMPRELARTRSMDYTMYNLEAFVTLAQVAEKVDVDLWNYTSEDGRSINLAYNYLYPYLIGESKWGYQNIVQENNRSFAPYLAIASKKFNNEDYAVIVTHLLSKDTVKENIMAYSFFEAK
jgi:hypothetical protein